MSYQLSQDFERTAPAPIDKSLVMTKAEMLAVDDNKMPDKYLTVCKDDNQIYIYDKAATPSSTTGKYSVLQVGSVYTAGAGINIANDEISVDTTDIQEKLTAGTGINATSLVNNTIDLDFATAAEVQAICDLVFGS